jgi:hypothetical protein
VDFKLCNGGREGSHADNFGAPDDWEDDQRRPEATSACASGAPACDSTREPRAALVATLAATLAELVAAGDLDGARVVNEAIGKLLLAERAGAVSGAGDVIPLRRSR